MVPFHMLHIVSYCAIVTLSLRHDTWGHFVFTIFVFKKFHDLEMGVKGHSRSLRVVSFDSSSSSSSLIIVRPLSRITTMGGVHTAQGARWSCVWNAVMVSALTQLGFRKRVPLRYCSDKKRMFILISM